MIMVFLSLYVVVLYLLLVFFFSFLLCYLYGQFASGQPEKVVVSSELHH